MQNFFSDDAGKLDLSSVFQTIDELDRLIEKNGNAKFISGEEFTIADIHIASLL